MALVAVVGPAAVFSDRLPEMRFAQLWPQQGLIELERYVRELELVERALPQRPFTLVNFVSTIDGRATVNGRSGPLGDEGDKALFHALRREVDAVLVGTGTLAAERYGRMIRDPAARKLRLERGLRPEPLACTLTRRGTLPLGIPLFDEPEAQIVAFTSAEVDSGAARARLDVVTMEPDELSFAAALAHLRADYEVRALLCEGGPRVFSALAHEGVFDQLFLTLSDKLSGGGDALSITSGAELPEPATMVLEGVLERQGTLFLRYACN